MHRIQMKLAEAPCYSLISYLDSLNDYDYDNEELGLPSLVVILSIKTIKFNVLSNHQNCKPSYEPGFEMTFLTSDGIVIKEFSKESRMNCNTRWSFVSSYE